MQQLLNLFRGFNHESRLRIVLLLAERPLCVQHLQQILETSQVEISKQLGYLRDCKLVEVEKMRNFRVYSLPAERSEELRLQLKCLRDCTQTSDFFVRDLERLKAIPRGPLRRRAAGAKEPKTPEQAPISAPEWNEKEPGALEDHLL
jgi:ArsR family transcriptional regulator, arsenate/arsenite/antimonite-responsive transcriptional repressor